MKKTVLAALLLVACMVPALGAGFTDLNIGISYYNIRQYEAAISWFDKALAADDLTPDQKRIAYLDRGLSYRAKGERQKAIDDYSSAIAAQPNDRYAYQVRAAAYRSDNQLQNAMADLEAYRKLRPYDHDNLITIGFLHWQMKDENKAAATFHEIAKEFSYYWLWEQVFRRKQGFSLDTPPKSYPEKAWPRPVVRFFQGDITEENLLEEAGDINACEARVLAGFWRIVQNDENAAKPLLKGALEKCSSSSLIGRIAKIESQRLEAGSP